MGPRCARTVFCAPVHPVGAMPKYERIASWAGSQCRATRTRQAARSTSASTFWRCQKVDDPVDNALEFVHLNPDRKPAKIDLVSQHSDRWDAPLLVFM